MRGLSLTAKLRYLITAACVAAILLTTCGLLAYQLIGYRRDVSDGLILRGRILSMTTTAALAFQNVADATEILKAFHLDDAVTSARIFDETGAVFARYNHPRYPKDSIPFRQQDGVRFEFTHDRITVWTPIEQQDKHLGTLAFSRTLGDLNKRIRESIGIALVVILIAAGFAFWLSHLLQGVISLPLLKLTEVARRVTEKNDYTVSADVKADGEIAILSTAFSQMLQALHERDRKIRSHAEELEKKVAERTALLEESNNDLKMFGNSVSHDLRSPLRSIMGFSELLGESQRLDEDGNDYVRRIQKNAAKMENLIEGLLRFSRLGSNALVKSEVDMASLVKDVVDELNFQAKGRKVNFVVDPALPSASAEAALIRQVWANLIGNAFKFTNGKDPAVITIGAIKAQAPPTLTYFVRDNGVGFEMQHAAKLFSIFERLHNEREFEGSGIGLATVHRILQRHGGRIWAEAKPGEGATFYFTV